MPVPPLTRVQRHDAGAGHEERPPVRRPLAATGFGRTVGVVASLWVQRSGGSGVGGLRPRRTASAAIPASAPDGGGQTPTTAAPGRVKAAAAPSSPKSATPPTPARGRRVATTPSSAANTPSRINVPTISACLSLLPNVRIANVFTAGGTWSTTQLPTATTGDGEPARSR